MKRVNLIVWVIVCSSVIMSCGTNAKAEKDNVQVFEVVKPQRLDTIYEKEYVAEIQSKQTIDLRTHVRGMIEKIHVDEGQAVTKGQLLFSLSNRTLKDQLLKEQANLKSLQAELKMAELNIRNTKLLADKNIVARPELEMAMAKKEAIEAKIEEAKAAISIANINLNYTEIKAPFSGVLNRIPYKVGSLVEEGELLTTLSNNEEVYAYFNVSEIEFVNLLQNQQKGISKEVRLMMVNNEWFPETGTIETRENIIDATTGNIAFRAKFKNPKRLLKHGATGRIFVEQPLNNILVIPQKATFEIQDKIYVYTISTSGAVKMKPVTVKTRLPHIYVIDDGALQESDMILFEGIQQVKEGMIVKPKILSFTDLSFN
ncbi:MAG: efflux RND transporter periplasmic adaptor subunit [Chitinophagaceae bacterium]|uniref:efflux RND transporter periplasmic adaptor subunit n=1 Tax=unclassified Paraflavitalea TaxID=2798305 RepID=UPI003D327DC7|nr:efflux RND transporter periplasmic adaptor subunit [Chitinophagaceae bacterium]